MHNHISRWLSRHTYPTLLIAVPLALAATHSLTAQTYRGSINGTVVDTSGASVPSASVVATDVDTNATISSTSSSGGEFLFGDLPLGTYTVTVTASGFATAKYDKVTVSAGVIYTLPVKLSVASASGETIEVNAASLTLDTATATNTTVLDSQTVEDLPLNGRDFTQMLQLTPGYGGYSGNGFGSLNGTRSNQLNWQIDGVDNNDLWHNLPAVNQGGVSGIAGIILPLDAVEQFSAQTQSGPEGGRNPGGTINLTLRAGTNRLHGSAYYFNRNELFGAKSPLTATKQKVRNYNTGFSLGGPFLKDRLFGFATFEHQRFVIGVPANATLPSIGWQNQARAILGAQGIPALAVQQNVLNTLWGTNRLSADTTGVKNNFYSNNPEFGYSWNALGKVDYRLSSKDNLSVHWFFGQGTQVAPVGSALSDFYQAAPAHVNNVAIVYNRLLNTHISNQLLAGVNYFNQVFNDSNTNFNVQSQGFLSGATFPNAPGIRIGSFARVGLTPPEGRNDITGHLTDQLSWTVGKHEFRIGGEYRNAQLDEFYHRKATGSFTFDSSRISRKAGDPTYADSGTPNQYDSYRYALAAYLAGQTTQANITIGNPERQVFVNTWFANAGDTWKLTPSTTLNYGVRWDYVGPLHNPQYKNLTVFRPNLASTANTGGLAIQGQQVSDLYQRYFAAISPRLGITQQVNSKMVFRAGYGWYFDTINLNPFLDNRPGNAAPNGVEGNPLGNDVVATISASPAGPRPANGKPLTAGQTQIVQGQNIFAGAGFTNFQNCTAGSQCGIFSVNPNFRPAVNQNYSFNLEMTLAPSVIGQIGYTGSQARHLLSLLDINQINNQGRAGSGVALGARPYSAKFPGYSNINEIQSIGTSNYNSLQADLRVQNFHRISASVAYTWSHNLDEVTAYRGALPQDSFNFKGDYGNSDFDTRNTFVAFASYQLPGSSHLKQLTNGWQLNTLASFHDGQPFSVFAGSDISGTNEGNDRAVQIGPIQRGYQGQKPLANWLDPAAFTYAPAGTFGTTHRNAYFGPGYSDVDFSVFKDTRIKEFATIQFRAEMFNLFNRTNYAPPGGGQNNSPTGAPAVGGDFTLNDTIGDYNGAPGIGAGEPFNTQFGLKVTF